jgi:hypothetical protein
MAQETTAAALLRPLYARFRHLLPPEMCGQPLFHELSHRMAHYK